MSKDIIWVAMKDGTGWASSRTRDEVDVAFTMIKTGGHGNISVIVRKPLNDYDSTSRARLCIGLFTYDTVDQAKAGIKNAMTLANAHSNKQDARQALVSEMLTHSNINPNSYYYINNNTVNQNDIGLAMIASSAVAPETTIVESPAMNSELEEWTKLVNSLEVSFTPEYSVSNAVEAMEEVIEFTNQVFDPSTWQPGQPFPSEYMLVNGNLIKMEWPK
jgi:hypothetical protein